MNKIKPMIPEDPTEKKKYYIEKQIAKDEAEKKILVYFVDGVPEPQWNRDVADRLNILIARINNKKAELKGLEK